MDSDRRILSPKDALTLLKEGNHRFIGDTAVHPHRDVQYRRDLARSGQQPYAAIVACSDSRLPLELMFDCGFGDIFAIRTAGNTFSPAVLAAVDFAIGTFNIPLLAVMGHSDCGAVSAVASGSPLPATIEPALATVRDAAAAHIGSGTMPNAETLAEANIWLTIDRLVQKSSILAPRLQTGEVGIGAAMCNTATSKVTWLQRPR